MIEDDAVNLKPLIAQHCYRKNKIYEYKSENRKLLSPRDGSGQASTRLRVLILSGETRTYIHPTPDGRSRQVLSPGLVIITAAPIYLLTSYGGARSGGRDRHGSIDRSIDRDDRASEAEGRGSSKSAAQAEPARFTRRSARSHRRKHDVGIHVAADYAPSSLARSQHRRISRTRTHVHGRASVCASFCEEAAGKYSL